MHSGALPSVFASFSDARYLDSTLRLPRL